MPALPANSPAHRILNDVFGYSSFRTGQEEVINNILDGISVLTVMPTGSGKSLCFQIPALVRVGLTVVVSPLVALMEDQVAALKFDGIAAETINSLRDRETNVDTWRRVAAGAVARLIVPQVSILAYVAEIGGDRIDPANFDAEQIGQNPFWCPDADAAARWETLVDDARKAGSSLGAVVECVATGVPAGWGAPLYAKLDSELAAAMMSINAVKGVEIGDGFDAARLSGEANADPMRPPSEGDAPEFTANHAGGIAGGVFGTVASIRRARINALLQELGEREGNGSAHVA